MDCAAGRVKPQGGCLGNADYLRTGFHKIGLLCTQHPVDEFTDPIFALPFPLCVFFPVFDICELVQSIHLGSQLLDLELHGLSFC